LLFVAHMYFRTKIIKGSHIVQLVHSYRNSDGLPRQRVIASLGDAKLPDAEKPSSPALSSTASLAREIFLTPHFPLLRALGSIASFASPAAHKRPSPHSQILHTQAQRRTARNHPRRRENEKRRGPMRRLCFEDRQEPRSHATLGTLHDTAQSRSRLPPTQRHARTAAEFPSTRSPRRRSHVDAFASRLRHPSGCLKAVCLRASLLLGSSASSPTTFCAG
jgi:hypothetical protein